MKELITLPYSVTLTSGDIMEHSDFILQRLENSKLYKKRGGFKESDLIIGLAAEIGAYKALSKQYDMVKPDTKIYDKKSKSYDADLHDEFGRCFHVKGQGVDSIKKFGPSWLFQRYDPLWKGEKNNEYFIFCGCTLSDKTTLENLPQEFEVDIFSIAKIGHLEELLNSEEKTQCKVWQLRGSKRALYLPDVIECIENIKDA